MIELPEIIRMNIAHYEALLRTDCTPEKRANIEQMLAEAKCALTSAARLKK